MIGYENRFQYAREYLIIEAFDTNLHKHISLLIGLFPLGNIERQVQFRVG